MNDAGHDDPTKSPPVSPGARRSIEDLDLELAEIEQSLPPPERRASRPSAPRRESIAELTSDLERLSADVPLLATPTPPLRSRTPISALPRKPLPLASTAPAQETARVEPLPTVALAPEPVVPPTAAEPPAPPSQRPVVTVPPVADDFDEIPAVLGLLGDDGEIRPALNPPAPAPRRSMPPPVPAAALEDRTVIMQLDGDLLLELDEASEDRSDGPAPEPPTPMREPTPVPEAGEAREIPSLPEAPGLPKGTDIAAAFDALPDLGDLDFGDMHEPSASPKTASIEDAESAADLADLASRRSG